MRPATTMRALWLENGVARLRDDVPVPEPPSGDALVRVTLAGICHTDLELIRGYYPYTGVLGHEFVGVVEAVEAVAPADLKDLVPRTPELVGRRVVGEINAVCGDCRHCRAGRSTHCERRTVLGIVDRNGAFAEYLTLPLVNLHPVPDGLPDEAAVFTEPLAAALEILEQVSVRPEDRVLVVGDGKLGQLVARVLGRIGCELLVLGRHERKLALLEEAGIAAAKAPNSRATAASTQSAGIKAGSFDLAVECTGNPSGFAVARHALRPRGTLVLKSTYAGALELDISSIVVDEITLVGSRCGPFPPALKLLEEGRVEVEPLVDARYSLAEAEEALEHAERAGTLKVLLEMGQAAGAPGPPGDFSTPRKPANRQHHA